MTEYVLGFAFTHDYALFNRVMLIRKLKPDWQAGHLNGIGGKVEPGEDPHRAMAREFEEEAGLESMPSGWLKYAELFFPGEAIVHVFSTWWDWKQFKKHRSMTAEQIEHYEIDDRFFEKMKDQKALHNLHWLIPMGLAAWRSNHGEHPVLRITEIADRGTYDPRIPMPQSQINAILGIPTA